MKNYTPSVMVDRFINRLTKHNFAVEDWQRQELTHFFQHYDLRTFIQNDYDRLTSMVIYQVTHYKDRWDIILKSNPNTLISYQAKYGEEEGLKRYQNQSLLKSITHKSKLSTVDQFIKTNAKRITVPITDQIKEELDYLLNNIQSLSIKRIYDWQKTICGFINYGLNDYFDRIQKLIPLRTINSLEANILRYGEVLGTKKYYDTNIKKRMTLPSSTVYWVNKGYSIEEAKEQIKLSQSAKGKLAAKKTKGRSEYSIRSIDYWIKQGLSKDEAKIKVKDIQSNTSLESMVKKYGEIEGKNRWILRNKRWVESMNKSGMKSGISKIAAQFFADLSPYLPNLISGKPEHIIESGISIFRVDGFYPPTNTVIEFFGDYWHANPTKYSESDIIKRGRHRKIVKDLWEQDAKRIRLIEAQGYRVVVIWESQYRESPKSTIDGIVSKLLT